MKELSSLAAELNDELQVREGKEHTVVRIGLNQSSVPRSKEIAEPTAKSILKKLRGNA
jgi:hypothetical protein